MDTVSRLNNECVGLPITKLAHYEDLEEQGLLVKLPCKPLDKVFVIPTTENNLSDITEMKCIGFVISHDGANLNLVNKKNKLYQPGFGDIGKTVFLTQEQAEQALKEMEGENEHDNTAN